MKEYTLTLPVDYTPPPLPGRDEWIAALRSGEYTQTKGKLQVGNSHCCLGVLCKLQGRLNRGFDGPIDDDCDVDLNPNNPLFGNLNGEGIIPYGVIIHMDRTDHNALSTLNDAGLSFAQIADIIEKVWSNGGPLPK